MTPPIDPAVLEPQLRKFHRGEVEWSFQYVYAGGGRDVLVVIVEPPRPGSLLLGRRFPGGPAREGARR